MKEMTIEEKAKAYDEALEKARNIVNSINVGLIGKDSFIAVFPVLKENEDERIMKSLKILLQHFCNGYRVPGLDFPVSYKDMLAWLEKQGEKDLVTCPICGWEIKKQGEQKPSEWHREDEQNLNACLGYIPDEFLRRWLTDIIHVKYDKHADKVEPKIKAGDWVVCNNGPHHIFQVIERSWPNAKYRDLNGTEIFLNVNTLDKQYHLWTIQDAKDGDVLACGNDIVIFKENNYNPKDKSGCMFVYCSCNNFYEIGGINPTDYKPATKEQRELLFSKMIEAGYTWDAEKKELKKEKEVYNLHNYLYGKQKPAWSEEDKDYYDAIIAKLEVTQDDALLTDNQMEFLKSLKERVQPQNIVYYNPYKEVVESIAEMCKHYDKASHSGLRDFYDDVKVKCKDAKEYESLYPQNTWKPSDGQMKALKEACDEHWEPDGFDLLYTLYQDLEKLRRNSYGGTTCSNN